MALMENLEEKYPALRQARLCFTQKNYAFASEFYSELLSTMEKNESIHEICKIYLEYAEVLIEEANEYFTLAFLEFAQQRAPNNTEKEEIEESLEIAWSLLEICRQTFAVEKDKILIRRIHTLLGDILLLNNNFQDAITEYAVAIENYEDIKIMQKMASCYEFLEDLNNYLEMNNKILAILLKQNKMDEVEELQAQMDHFKKKIENKEQIPEKVDDSANVIDITKTLRKK
ncbi:Histine-binding protein N1/N2 -like protein [Spraguea lophii 42_110]|uniref:Histine-binding protein N1/N2-like protein n=1 Tax=Spraguea lophii (strain 42_110) TaxID=1358809 RepID=S7XVC3_SPRLO|nr:Histine-binding protein N1/N2 -like protein [Spraguea lophii 42_110]